jgi:hypothetical protein
MNWLIGRRKQRPQFNVEKPGPIQGVDFPDDEGF